MNSVKFDPAARDEFLDAVVYYEQCRKGLGKSFRKQVELALSKISEMPFLYRIIHPPFRRFLLTKFPYSIIYTIEPDHIRIIAVAHMKRKPDY